MINLLPPDQDKTFWNPNTTFLDIYCKSGVFLEILYRRLMGVLANFSGYEDEQVRSSHILNNQLFGLSPLDDSGLMLATRRVYGDIFHKNLIHYDIQNVMKDISSRAGKNFELYEQNLVNTLKQVTNKEFNKMNFNVVIGNPPYNRGGDIDFVDLSYEIQTNFVVMITPAKWQTAEADQKIASKMSYGQFRKKLVPHMREVVFYPDCTDVFSISQVDGVVYYIIDKMMTYEMCKVHNRCNRNSYLNSDENRSINNCESLLNIGNEIIQYINSDKSFKISEYTKGNYETWIIPMTTVANSQATKGKYLLSDAGDTWVITIPHQFHADDIAERQILAAESRCVFKASQIEQCKQFEQYIKTKFVRFLVLCNIQKLNNIFVDHTFRFVPSPMVLDAQGNRVPGKFDHIYTDEELYKTWNLPQKYIDVIEAVIKERK